SMKKVCLVLLITLLVLNSLAVGEVLGNTREKKSINIGLIYDESNDFNQYLYTKLKKEMEKILIPNYQLNFTTETGSGLTDLEEKLDDFLQDNEIDLVVTAGMASSHLTLKRNEFNKPVIAPFIIDNYLLSDKLDAEDQTGIANLNLITSKHLLRKELETFQELKDFDQLTFLAAPLTKKLLPNLEHYLANELEDISVEVLSVTDTTSADLSNSQAVYLSPLLNLKQEQLENLTAQLKREKIPLFSSVVDSLSQESNLLAAYAQREALQQRARIAALNLESYLLGTKVSQLPIYTTDRTEGTEQLIINLPVAEEINLLPNWKLLDRAELINSAQDSRRISLDDAVEKAVDNNLEVAVKDKEERIAQSKLQQAENNLKPQLDLKTTYTRVREDNAIRSQGKIKEKTHSGSVELKQVLFDEQINAQSDIQQSLYQRAQATAKEEQWDIILSAMTNYYNVLRMRADVNLQQENVDLTKENLEIAQTKQQIGSTSPADTYRWQSELAMNDSSVTQAKQELQEVKDNLKRILNLPLNQKITTKEVKLMSVVDQIKERFKVANPWQLAQVSDRLVKLGLENSVELEQLDYSIQAQQRRLKMLQRDFYLPELGLQANYKSYFDERGAGTKGYSPSIDEWSLAVQADFSLYEGGNKQERLNEVKEEIKKLKQQRQAVVQKLEQQIRQRVRNVNTQYRKYQNTEQAVEAAANNLDLVRDAYSKGSASVAQLLDAQSALIKAKRKRSTIKYDFLIAVAEAKRSLGILEF
ncbi:MAG: TolC family protein, partial [Bacillota bacterium]